MEHRSILSVSERTYHEPSAPTTMPSDDALVRAWKRGDRGAGAELVRRHEGALRRHLARRFGRESADDLMQQTFLVCTQNIHRIEDASKFAAFLFGVGRRVAFAHGRARRSRTDRYAALTHEPLPIEAETPSRLVRLRQEGRNLMEAVEQLPAEWQLAVILHYWHGLSAAEIAGMREVAEGTVKSWLCRARAELRRRLPAELLAAGETLSQAKSA